MLNATGTGLSDGGCGVFAHAVTFLLPEATMVTAYFDGDVEHYAAKYKGLYLDGLGAHPGEDGWITAMEIEWPDLVELDTPVELIDGFVEDTGIACGLWDDGMVKYEMHIAKQLKALHSRQRVPEAIS
jgi:hypothetical protein